jgi:hypothetical protein
MRNIIIGLLLFLSFGASAQWQQTGSKVRYVNGLGIPTKDTAAGVSADSSQILIRPADSSLYVKYKRTWLRVGGGAGGGSIGGSGTTNFISKFTASGFIGNSSIVDSASAVVMTINPSGNVGIGTASPVRNLTLSGSSAVYQNIQGGTSNDVGLLLGVNGNDAVGRIVYSNANNNIQLWTNSTQQVTLLSTGFFGIGYTAPAAKLSVNGTTLINTNTDNGVDKLQVSGGVTASGTLTAATIVKAGGTSSQFLMADGSTSLGGGGSLSGTTNYVAKFTSSSAIGNSQIIDDGTNVSLRTTASTYAVNINTGANSGIGFYQDGGTAVIIGTNADVTAISPISIRGTTVDLDGNLKVNAAGRVLIGNPAPNDNTVDAVQINGTVLSTQYKLSALNTAPASASATGTLGEIRIDANYIYICTATNTWKRVAIATW